MVFHPCGIRFGIGENSARGINNGDPSTGGLAFLGGDFSERVGWIAVGFDAVGKELSFLDEIAFDFCAKRGLPRAADHYVEDYGGSDDDDEEGRHQFEKDPISHFLSHFRLAHLGASKR
jgi:hypothetical protein